MRRRHGDYGRTALTLAGPVLASLLLAGCHPGAGGPAATTKAKASKTATSAAEPAVDPAVAEANRSMASGVPIGASTAPLEIRFDVGTVPSPGQPFAVDVAVLPEAPAPVLRLEVSGGEGLTILEPDGPVTFEKVQAGSVTHLQVRASSAAAGTRLMQVLATLELPNGPESRVFAFPLVVGAPPVPAPAAPPAPKAATR